MVVQRCVIKKMFGELKNLKYVVVLISLHEIEHCSDFTPDVRANA